MQEFGPYKFTGELGDQASINDMAGTHYSTSLLVGFIDGQTGVSGLDDAPKRQNIENVTVGQGGAAGPVYDAPREVTFPILVGNDAMPDGRTLAQRLTALDKATRGQLPFGCTVQWFDSDQPTVEKILYMQRAQRFTVTGLRPRLVSLGFVAVEPRIVSVVKHSQTLSIGMSTGLSNLGTRDAPWRLHLSSYNNITFTLPANGPYPGSKVVIPGSGTNLVVQGGRLPGIFTDSAADPTLPSYQDAKGWANLVIAAGAAQYPNTYWGGFPPGSVTPTCTGTSVGGTLYWWDAW
jgi:hypothetical protein